MGIFNLIICYRMDDVLVGMEQKVGVCYYI